MKTIISASVFLVIMASNLFSQTFEISGTIVFKENLPIIIEISNKEEYEKNIPSKYKISLDVTNFSTSKTIPFTITGIPEGYYIVKVWQDKNNNGLYNWAFIGGDPIAVYKEPGIVLGRPSFASISFLLSNNLKNITIKL